MSYKLITYKYFDDRSGLVRGWWLPRNMLVHYFVYPTKTHKDKKYFFNKNVVLQWLGTM